MRVTKNKQKEQEFRIKIATYSKPQTSITNYQNKIQKQPSHQINVIQNNSAQCKRLYRKSPDRHHGHEPSKLT